MRNVLPFTAFAVWLVSSLQVRGQISLESVKERLITAAEKEISLAEKIPEKWLASVKDSLQQRINAGESLKLSISKGEIPRQLRNPRRDTQRLEPAALLIPRRNNVAIPYLLEQGDSLQFIVRHNSLLPLSRVEVLAAGVPVYARNKLRRKDPLAAKIPAVKAGEILLRLSNRQWLDLKSTLYVRILKRERKLVAREMTDTLYLPDTSLVTREDIQYLPLTEMRLTVGASRNLSQSPFFLFPIPFVEAVDAKGWAFWTGYQEKSEAAFQLLNATGDALAGFAAGKVAYLPDSEPRSMRCALVDEPNANKLIRGADFVEAPLSYKGPRGPNYGLIMGSPSRFLSNRLYLACLNFHGAASQTVYFRSIYLKGIPVTEQVINQRMQLRPYLKITAE